jgi:type IV pilus assembly protein PilM
MGREARRRQVEETMPVAIGLDIGTDAVRAAVVETGKATPVLRRFGEMPLPEGATDAGEIVDPGAVAESIAALWKRLKLPRKRIVAGIASQRVIVRQIEVPALDEGELADALPYLAQEALPIPVEEAALDYVPVEEFASEEGEPMLSVLVVASPRDTVDAVMDVAGRAGIAVMAVDLQTFALVRGAFGSDLLIGGGGSQALVDIGGSLTQIAVVRDGMTRFVRILPTGGRQFTQALVTGLSLDDAEAEDLKRRVGVLSEGSPEGEDVAARAGDILSRTADALIEEVRGSITYYLTQSGEQALERLVVAGNGARLPHLANRLGRSLGVAVEPARVLDHVDVGRIQMTEGELLAHQPVLPASVGLGLWGQFVVPPAERYEDV